MKADRKALKQIRVEFLRERSQALKPLEKRINELEGAIVKAETELLALYEGVESASRNGDSAAIAEISIKIHAYKKEIEKSFRNLETASLEYEEKKAAFEVRRKELAAQAEED